MPIINNELEIKGRNDSLFLSIKEGKHNLQILSKLYFIPTHFISKEKGSALCIGDGCLLCQQNLPRRKEFYYWAKLDDGEGILRVPATVFYSMNEIEGAVQKSKRNFKWLLIRRGTGRETKYTVTQIGEIKPDEETIEENTKKLQEVMEKFEKRLRERYDAETAVETEEVIDLPEDDLPFSVTEEK